MSQGQVRPAGYLKLHGFRARRSHDDLQAQQLRQANHLSRNGKFPTARNSLQEQIRSYFLKSSSHKKII